MSLNYLLQIAFHLGPFKKLTDHCLGGYCHSGDYDVEFPCVKSYMLSNDLSSAIINYEKLREKCCRIYGFDQFYVDHERFNRDKKFMLNMHNIYLILESTIELAISLAMTKKDTVIQELIRIAKGGI